MFSLDHVHVVCEDLAVTGDFLELLGARLDRRNEQTLNWEYTLGAVRVFLRAYREQEARAGQGASPLDHLGFTVADIEAAAARLLAAGCTVRVPVKRVRPDLATGFFDGPGGLVVELLQRG